ncbi:MAG TPA: PA14 domain-containing protein [Methylomirabilota bacterium]|nr:PA14 domain-containing protein [Methylomirabilota bacterium]
MKKQIFTNIFFFLLFFFASFFPVLAAEPPLPAINAPYNLRDRFSTDLFTGTATYSYEIKVPKGTDDLTPNIGLSYNSAGARDFYQRVGTGWQLTQNYVERDVNFTPGDTNDDKFKLHFKGNVYDLVYVSGDSRYHTKIESSLNITKLATSGTNDYSEYWQVITPDGTKYRFGYAFQSELVCNGRSYVASWNLDQVTDMHGNNIYYTYTESNGTSYISQIKYNNDQSREVDYTYGTSSYTKQVYIQGCNVTESSQLTNIQVKIGTNLIHQYDLSYSTAGDNQQLLHAITEKGTDGTSTLPATTFDYKTENKTWNTTPQTWVNNAPMDVNLTKSDVELADANGDGLLDIVKSEGNGTNLWKVWKNNGSGWNTTYETWVNNQPIDAKLDRPDTKLMDVTGDGLPDIVKAADASSWRIWRNTGASWSTYQENWADVHSYGSQHYLGSGVTKLVDVTGDGLPDIVTGDANLWRVFRNTGSGWNNTPETWTTSIPQALDDPTFRIMDVNGDGLADIVRATANGTNDTWQVWKNNGNGWNSSPDNPAWINNAGIDANFSMTNVTVQDVNGDGLPDIVKSDDLGSADKWKVLLNQGNSWSTTWETWIDPSSNVDLSLQATTQMADVNGDGLPDIIKGYDTNNPGGSDTWQVYKNNGNAPDLLSAVHTSQGATNSFNYAQAVVPSLDTVSTATYSGQYFNNQTLSGSPTVTRTDSVINFAWDTGSPDPSVSSDQFSARWTQTRSLSAGTYIFNVVVDDGFRLYVDGELLIDQWNDHGPRNFAASKALTDGTHTIVVEYYENTGGATILFTYQKIALPFPLWQVSQMTTNNGMTGSELTNDVTTYSYKNAFYKFEDREFRGYGEVDTVEPNGSKSQNIFNQDNAVKGKPASIQTNDSSNNPYSKTEDTWSNTLTNGVYTANLNSEKNYTYDGSSSNPKVTQDDYQYDSYGNVTKKSEKGDISTASDDRFIYNEYTVNLTAWIVNTPKHSYLNASDDSTKVSENWFYYDNNTDWNTSPTKGDLTKEVKRLDTMGDTNPVTQYAYDTYGNQTSVTDANSHTTTTAYDSATHTYPISVTNAKNQTITLSYDLGTGNLLSKTDPNSKTTSYTYDVFGRILKEIKPYDSTSYPTTVYQYLTDGTAPEGVLVSKRETASASGTLDTYTWVDGLNRTVQTRSEAEDTSLQTVTDISYDTTGQVAKITVPHFDTLTASYASAAAGIRSTQTSYDPIGRPNIITNPKGDTKTIAYDHWKETSVDENGHIKRNYSNAFNKIVKIDEVDGGLTYSTNYAYNPRDQLSSINDTSGNNTSFVYDSLGRKTSQTDPDMGTWQYTYDDVGNLKTQKDARNITTTRTYDELDRLNKLDYPTDTDTTFAYDTGKVGTLAIATDSAGMVSYQYDDRLRKKQEQRSINGTTKTTQWGYDSLDRTATQTYPDNEVVTYAFNTQGEINSVTGSSTIMSNIDYNALGKITQKDFANGLTTNYTYNTNDFRLNRIQTGTVQDMNYTYDNVGNVATRTNNLTSKTENFTYDDLDRLKTATESASGYNYAYEYNPIGNLTRFTNAGIATDYTYGQTAGPHALTIASGSAQQASPSGTEILGTTWTLTGNNGSAEADKGIASSALSGMNSVQITFNLHGTSFGSGDDEASVVFIQNNDWRAANVIVNGGQNGLNGSQTVTIPISSFHKVGDASVVLDPNQAVSNLHARFWNSGLFSVDITSVKLISASGSGGGGSTNLALNKTVTTSSVENNDSTLVGGKAVDGSTSTRWSSSFSDPQWMYVDLGSSQSINRVKLVWETAYGSAYQIQTSNDATNWTTIYSTSSGDGGTDDLTGLSGTGRYVRMYGTSRATIWGYSLYEFEVYGTSSGGTTTTNIAPNGTGYKWWGLSSSTSNNNKVAASGLNDSNMTTDVRLDNGTDEAANVWEGAGVTFSATQSAITSIEFTNGTWETSLDGSYIANFKLQFTTDGTTWTDSGWSNTPSYPYNSSSVAGQTYTFTGSATAIKGARVVGQVHSSNPGASSWYDNAREVKIYQTTSTGGGSGSNGGTGTYTYDADGNMTSDGATCYEYNEANQLKKVKRCSDGQVIADYVYDYNGNRMVKKNYTNGTLANTMYSWSDSYETKVINGGGTENTSYYFANDQLIAKKDNSGNRTYFHNDHLGSTSVVTNQSGTVVETTAYDPWGKIKSGGTASKFNYTGQEHDSETGLDYYNARYYSSDIRRFTQPDDIIQDVYNPQDLNRYTYARNNPLRYTDPSGHSIIDTIIKYATKIPVIGSLIAKIPVVQQYTQWVESPKVTTAKEVVKQVTSNTTVQKAATTATSLTKQAENIAEKNTTNIINTGSKITSGGKTIGNITSKWYKSTSKTVEDAIDFHLEKHGAGRTAEEYTEDALQFFKENRDIMKNTILKDGTQGVKIRIGNQGGYFTPEGKIVTYWDN